MPGLETGFGSRSFMAQGWGHRTQGVIRLLVTQSLSAGFGFVSMGDAKRLPTLDQRWCMAFQEDHPVPAPDLRARCAQTELRNTKVPNPSTFKRNEPKTLNEHRTLQFQVENCRASRRRARPDRKPLCLVEVMSPFRCRCCQRACNTVAETLNSKEHTVTETQKGQDFEQP